jgi:hypothetical protein
MHLAKNNQRYYIPLYRIVPEPSGIKTAQQKLPGCSILPSKVLNMDGLSFRAVRSLHQYFTQ